MGIEQIKVILLVISLTLLSGIADAYGFLHAARIWQDTRISWWELIQASLGFALGISIYFLVIRYMQQLGIVLPEIQSIAWFVVTMVGVAMINGQFVKWPLIDQIVAGAVLAGVGWLMLRTGG